MIKGDDLVTNLETDFNCLYRGIKDDIIMSV
jgi:hypothetical protein